MDDGMLFSEVMLLARFESSGFFRAEVQEQDRENQLYNYLDILADSRDPMHSVLKGAIKSGRIPIAIKRNKFALRCPPRFILKPVMVIPCLLIQHITMSIPTL